MDRNSLLTLILAGVGGYLIYQYLYGGQSASVMPSDSGAVPADTSGFDWGSLFDFNNPTVAPAASPASAPAPATSGFDYTSLFDFLSTPAQDTTVAPSTETTASTSIMSSAYWKTGSYPQFATLIANVEISEGIPTDLLARLLYQESHFRPDIINCSTSSPVGAQGIAQFMPGTAAQFGINPCDPSQAIPAAGKYLRSLYGEFGDWSLALMAYNWGPGNVQKWVASGESNPVPQETQNYVAQITADVSVA